MALGDPNLATTPRRYIAEATGVSSRHATFASAALPISHMNSINLDSITANHGSFSMWSDGVEPPHRPRELTRGSGSTCDFPRELHALAIHCNLTKGSLSDLLDVFTIFFLVFRHTYLPLQRISCAQTHIMEINDVYQIQLIQLGRHEQRYSFIWDIIPWKLYQATPLLASIHASI